MWYNSTNIEVHFEFTRAEKREKTFRKIEEKTEDRRRDTEDTQSEIREKRKGKSKQRESQHREIKMAGSLTEWLGLALSSWKEGPTSETDNASFGRPIRKSEREGWPVPRRSRFRGFGAWL